MVRGALVKVLHLNRYYVKKLILLALLPIISFANTIDDKCPQFISSGAPVSSLSSTVYMCKKNYAINYRIDTKTAEYVVEHPTKLSIKGLAKRNDDFHVDESLPKKYQSTINDYNASGYDRGHLAPAGDNTISSEVMSESFALSNMVPQNPSNNRVIWNHLETKVRDLVLSNRDIYVSSGTYYKPTYKTIGLNKVGVPDFLWKVIYDKSSNKVIAFLIPNTALNVKDLPKFIISVSDLEHLTNINFFPLMPNSNIIESVPGSLKDWAVFN
jgi:endonuclease G